MANIHRAIGIDLGTTNSVMAMMRGGEPKVINNQLNDPLTPSVVSVRKGELLVGKPAKSRLYDRDVVLSVKRFMGLPYGLVQEDKRRVHYEVSEGPGQEVRIHFNNRTYSPTEISAMILNKMRLDAQDRLGERVGRAVITVPAYFNDSQVAATREAGRMAGFTVLRIIREPTAAAMAFGLDRSLDPEGNADTASVLVYDLGGGTFDISIMMMVQGIFQVMGVAGDKHLGGDDFDYEIMKRLYQRAGLKGDLASDRAAQSRLKLRAEDAKKELSSVASAEITVPSVAGTDIEDELTREEFNEIIASWLARTLDLTRQAMRETKMTPDLIDHILLVGGSTLIPAVQEDLRREFGDQKLKKNVDPMLCVALGAAIQTTLVDQIECPNPECRDGAGQPTKNPIDATKCSKCHASLIGFDTVLCETCFVPLDAANPTCGRCKSTTSTVVDVPPKPLEAQTWKCIECEYPKNSPKDDKCQVCGKPREVGGQKCLKCGHVNPPGRVECMNCRSSMGGETMEAVPEDLGIELQNGRMAVIVKKNTAYSLKTGLKSISRDFSTPEANRRQLEVVVWQGPHERAAENEYCGVVMLDLPPDLPKGAAVTVALGLDSDGTITAAVQLREFPNRRVIARIVRGGAVDIRRRRDELLQKAKEAHKEDENAPEATAFARKIAEMENDQSPSREENEQFEQELQAFQDSAQERDVVQDVLRESEAVLGALKDFRRLIGGDVAELERLRNNVVQMTARDPQQAQQHARELQVFLQNHVVLRLIGYINLIRQSGRISVTLANRVGAALRTLQSVRNQAEWDKGVEDLFALWDEVTRELGDQSVPPIVKPV